MKKLSAQGICLIFCLVLFLSLAVAFYARAGEKEELTANMKAVQWEFNYIQERVKTLQIEAQRIQGKLDDIEKKEKEAKKDDKKNPIK
jgi:uncharacterized protein YlxW (UPF0749 family)